MDNGICNICTELRKMLSDDLSMRERASHLKLALRLFGISFVSGFLLLALSLAAYAAKSGGGSLLADAGNDALWTEGILAGLGAPAFVCLFAGALFFAFTFAAGVLGTILLVSLCIGMETEAQRNVSIHEGWIWLASAAFLAAIGWLFGGAAPSLIGFGIGCAFFPFGCFLFFRIDKERERGIAA